MAQRDWCGKGVGPRRGKPGDALREMFTGQSVPEGEDEAGGQNRVPRATDDLETKKR